MTSESPRNDREAGKNCLRCIFLHIRGYGYSNWTWEGDEMVCLKSRFDAFEKEYEDEKNEGKLALAAKDCPHFAEGDPLETAPDDDSEELAKARLSGEPEKKEWRT